MGPLHIEARYALRTVPCALMTQHPDFATTENTEINTVILPTAR